MVLIIDSSGDNRLKIILARSGDNFKIKQITIDNRATDQLLRELDVFLRQNGVKLGQLRGLAAVIGPGGFTNLRIGIAVANALAYARKLPIVGLTATEFNYDAELVRKTISRLKRRKKFIPLLPAYGREPNIG
ncbi:MAG TPA: tRNA (adenosine(37)-N6)-threonylcarbamoyltransferase complex dimerization subunit type 1 TsaB [bacterium]|nr:tRNA (adenosine(37)-N6)-threonylcarbamoyltransferase complex dimerization subunit type 1 TsaB [bacterium]HOH67340.1 tRNA (adenosine(37)-N6)-threonylcarbamoyltransferase complex dimerization subunit type 1 TsaB [bacterium]